MISSRRLAGGGCVSTELILIFLTLPLFEAPSLIAFLLDVSLALILFIDSGNLLRSTRIGGSYSKASRRSFTLSFFFFNGSLMIALSSPSGLSMVSRILGGYGLMSYESLWLWWICTESRQDLLFTVAAVVRGERLCISMGLRSISDEKFGLFDCKIDISMGSLLCDSSFLCDPISSTNEFISGYYYY